MSKEIKEMTWEEFKKELKGELKLGGNGEDERMVNVAVPYEVYMIKCPNPKCEMRFTLHALLWWEEDKEWVWVRQTRCEYCPYCGEKIGERRDESPQSRGYSFDLFDDPECEEVEP
mgnify:CR=1 FL=1